MAQWPVGGDRPGLARPGPPVRRAKSLADPGLPPNSVDNFVENPLRNWLKATPDAACDALMTF